jgi:uncharacterized protein (TIGR03083 family)
MTLSTSDCLAAIEQHSAGLAEAARGNLDARVEHCPEWDVADLVWHVTGVQWFWATIAGERLAAPPDESRRPARPPRERLVERFEDGARRLVDVLRGADQHAACWTWAPQQDVAFVTRHQVQEAAVHHWDAVHATGGELLIDDHVALDAVEEFLTFSVSSDADPADPPRPPLAGAIWLCPCETVRSDGPPWLVTDGATPGTLAWQRVPEGADVSELVPRGTPLVGGHVAPDDVLLWLYGRLPLPGRVSGDLSVLDRFRALTFTG